MEGRGFIVSYEHNPKVFYYRELIEGTKSYRSKKIEGVDNVEDGKKKVLDIILEFSGRVPSVKNSDKTIEKKLRTQDVELSVHNFIEYERERMESGLIKYKTYNQRKLCLNKHLIPYLKSRGITKTRQINDETFSHYLIYRKGIKKLTVNGEIVMIKNFLSEWLVKKRLIEPEVVSNRRLFPVVKIRMEDLMSNPPINGYDWKIINLEIRRWVRESTNIVNHRVNLWRTIFWNFTLISKNSGCRPEELMKLKWKDVEVVDVGRISESMKEEEIQELRSEGIEVFDDESISDGGWVESNKSFGREQRLISYITVTSGKTGQIREVPTNTGYVFVRLKDYLNNYYKQHSSNRQVEGNDLVFGNVNNYGRPYDYSMFNRNWRNRVRVVKDKLKGNKFTDENYTVYSMRSTFITNKLISGLDIFLLSRITGHDVKILMRHYERMDIRRRSEEITKIEYGRRRNENIKVKLFDD